MEDTKQTKACPFCGEEILAVAVKCKHCGSDLSTLIATEATASLQTELRARIKQYITEHRPTTPGVAFDGKLYCTPDIPPKKIEAAKSKYAEKLPADEGVLVLGEDRTFGGAMLTTGLLLTDRALYYYGVDDPKASVGRGVAKGFVPLHQIKKIEFKHSSDLFGAYSTFELNGLTHVNSKLVPRYFEIGEQGSHFMNGLFVSLADLLPELEQNVQRSQPPPAPAAQPAAAQRPASAANPRNPVEVGEKPEPGCFKSGCAIIGMIVAAIIFLLGLLILFHGMTH